jgi:small subunit ribosomal protein S9
LPTGTYIEGIGRRKTAIARVRIYPGGGDLLVNGQAMGQYFGGIYNASQLYLQPFRATDTATQFAVSAKISGSGIHAQLEALIHGISRALVAHNPDYRLALKELGFLTRDDRMKETRKIGTGGKARRKRQSPKR